MQINDEKYRKDADIHLEDYMGITEMGKVFDAMIRVWQKDENRRQVINYIEKHKDELDKVNISLEQAKQIAYDFYRNIGLESEYKKVVEGYYNVEVNIGTMKDGKKIYISGMQEEDGEYLLNVTDHNSIETVFIIVHEFMHAMTMYDDFSETKYLLREVCPYVIELILYEYIIENREKYGLEEEIIQDLNIIKFMRFLNYFDKPNRCLRTDYIIALIITTQLENKTVIEKKEVLLTILELLETNDVVQVLESLGLRLNRKQPNDRKKYIEDIFNAFVQQFSLLISKQRKK